MPSRIILRFRRSRSASYLAVIGSLLLVVIVLIHPSSDFFPAIDIGCGSFCRNVDSIFENLGDLAFSSYNRQGVPIYNNQRLKSLPPLLDSNLPGWSNDDDTLTGSSWAEVRPLHPVLFAHRRRWDQLASLVPTNPYLARWNKTVFDRAEVWYSEPPVTYLVEGPLDGNGVLDVAREFQRRIKHWCYAYKLSKDPKWKDRVWKELQVASGNTTQYFGNDGDNWNTRHWLDVGEFLVAFAIAHDWLYDAWTTNQRVAIMWTMLSLGLKKGLQAYNTNMWFLNVKGNWNCVVNGGLIVGSLSIYYEDPTGIAKRVLSMAVENARTNCGNAAHPDGTWSETPDYWYFGTQAHAQISSALLSATRSTQGMLHQTTGFKETSMFHIYNYGMTGLFNYGDCGPPKLTATANSLLFYGDQFGIPLYTLYQRDRPDAADPLSILWYEPRATGFWFYELPLDRNFPDPNGAWVSMRSSWSSPDELFVAMKAGKLTGHQTHGNLDVGDFVLDALGERWAGELCHDNYLAPGYFSSEAQDSMRWLYYRCRTEGQNTLLLDDLNQVVDTAPRTVFQSTNTTHNSKDFSQDSSTAFWIADIGTAYLGDVGVKRALRLLQGRRQVLIQDEIMNSESPSQWRMHTNATISYSRGGRTAHLKLNQRAMDITIDSPSMLSFRTLEPIRLSSDPTLPERVEDLGNPGVSVLAIDVPPGSHTIAVRFTPIWTSSWRPEVPGVVPISQWSLTSHNTS